MSDVQAEAHDEDAAETEFTERLARRYGWKPETDWKGDRSKWTPAQKFMDQKLSGLDSLPALRAKADKVDHFAAQLTAIKAELGRNASIRLTQEMEDAVEANDKEAARLVLQKARSQVGDASDDDAKIADTRLGAEVSEAWVRDNDDWFGVHLKATQYAKQLFAEAADDKGDSRWSREAYETRHKEIERKVKARYPSVTDDGEDETNTNTHEGSHTAHCTTDCINDRQPSA